MDELGEGPPTGRCDTCGEVGPLAVVSYDPEGKLDGGECGCFLFEAARVLH